MEIKLGQKVKDVVSGLEGIVTAKIEYLNGCIQFCVKPKASDKDTKFPEGDYIDVEQLKVIGKGLCKTEIKPAKKRPPGGLMQDRPKNTNYRG